MATVIGMNASRENRHSFPSPGFFQPTSYFLVGGSGDATQPLVAFDKALLAAGIGDVNLVRLSSIVAPGLPCVEPVALQAGSLVAVAYASIECDCPGTLMASAVAIAHPKDSSRASVIMEHSALAGIDLVRAEAEAMAREAMVSRDLELGRIESVGVEHRVCEVGCTFAGVVEI